MIACGLVWPLVVLIVAGMLTFVGLCAIVAKQGPPSSNGGPN